ncbi:hypothetical protein LB505_007233 [Fusarium chuoi]|nr:hypothetical protein LB505_007233 [Fusarium chuoi]
MNLSLDAIKDDGLTRDAFFEQMKRNDEKRIPATVYHCIMRMEDILGPEEKTEPSRSMYSIHKVVDDMASVIMMTLHESTAGEYANRHASVSHMGRVPWALYGGLQKEWTY